MLSGGSTMRLTHSADRCTHVDRFGPAGGRVVVVELFVRLAGLSYTPLRRRSGSPGSVAGSQPSSSRPTPPLRSLCTPLRSSCSPPSAAHLPARRREPGSTTSSIIFTTALFERVTLDELAAVAGVHRAHLVRSFRARYGVSIGVYVRRERIRWAARALRHSDAPLAEIALRAGFADQSHFTRTFVKHMGVSPGRYRRG